MFCIAEYLFTKYTSVAKNLSISSTGTIYSAAA